jgi:murein DD-endopeptidase MepM/ murein hydrolase activator NlpD
LPRPKAAHHAPDRWDLDTVPSPLSALSRTRGLSGLRASLRRLRPSASQIKATILVTPAFIAMAVFGAMASHSPAAAVTASASAADITPHLLVRHADRAASRSALRPAVVPAATVVKPPAPAPAPPPPVHHWVLPADGPLSSPFGMRWGRMHDGIDLAAPYGAPIRAATDGTSMYAGPEAGYGTLILVRDYDGTVTAYGHMSRYVRTSGPVHAGDVIALVGAAGDATGAHLHFEVRVNGVKVDPIPFLAQRGVRI